MTMLDPILILDQNGNPSRDPVMGLPCIRIGYSFMPPTQVPDGHLLKSVQYAIALIDTGADINMLHSDIFKDNHSPEIQTITSYGVNGASTITMHNIYLWLPENKFMQKTGIAKWSPTPGQKSPYKMILGRKFLQCVRFTYDGTNGITSFSPFHNPNAV